MYSYSTFNALGPGSLRLSQKQATVAPARATATPAGPQFLDGVLVSVSVTGDVFSKSTNVVQRLGTELARAFLSQYV